MSQFKRADVIQVDTWTCASGRNGMRREWVVRDCKTGKSVLRAVWLKIFIVSWIDLVVIMQLYIYGIVVFDN